MDVLSYALAKNKGLPKQFIIITKDNSTITTLDNGDTSIINKQLRDAIITSSDPDTGDLIGNNSFRVMFVNTTDSELNELSISYGEQNTDTSKWQLYFLYGIGDVEEYILQPGENENEVIMTYSNSYSYVIQSNE